MFNIRQASTFLQWPILRLHLQAPDSLTLEPEDDDRCESSGGYEDDRAPVVSGRKAAPIFQASEHDLDAVAAFVVSNGLLPALPAGDAGHYPFVFQRLSEPVGIIAPVGQHPLGPGRLLSMAAAPVSSLTEPAVTNMRIGRPPRREVLYSSHPSFARSACHAPLFTHRLEAVRWAFR